MLARGALCRLAAEVPKQATHDLSKLTTLVQTARSGFALPIRTLSHAAQLQVRSYATTKAATDSTGTVKKAVKTKAAAGKSVKKTTTTKKAPAKKKAAPKKAKKKAAPKKPARKPKKVLTDEEKEKKALTQLRKLALKEPVSRNQLSAFNVYLAEKVKESDQKSTETLAAVAKTYKDITAAERERLNHKTAEVNEARLAEYNAWVKTYTPDEIRIANNARRALKRKLKDTRKSNAQPKHTAIIVDDRQVLGRKSAWTFFFSERQQSSDMKGISVPEKAKLISSEWKELSADEKKRFDDLAAADSQRYQREMAAASKA
ncbi:hypothetical protein SLS59_003761 [Nothophoma quercina]|uniref:HMG box domain-containing protein n=1 Tax=Nothophoma quercina TaxID=749835 RepID=A0ABR3RJE5_9PLEO